MKHIAMRIIAVVAFLAMLAACGGGGGASTGVGGGATITGTAGTGSPIQNATVTAQGANGATASGTTGADGTFTISNVDALTFPVRLSVSFPEGGAVRTLRSVVAALNANSARANINPITEVIAENTQGINDATTLNAAITRLSAVIAAILADYDVPAGTNFISGPYVANPSDPVDQALDLLTVSFSNGNLVVTSNADPGTQVVVAVTNQTTAGDIGGGDRISKPAATAYADPTAIKALVDALALDLARGRNLTAADLNDVFHDDFVDDGYNTAQFAEGIAEEAEEGLNITVTGYRILRCFTDDGAITDRCYIRVNFKSPTLPGEDFGGVAGQATVADFIDLVAERRDGGALRFAGGFFRPFAFDTKLVNLNRVTVDAAGAVINVGAVELGLSMYAQVAAPGANPEEPEELANSALNRVRLVKDFGTDGAQTIMTVSRSSEGECDGRNARLNVDPAGNQCGNQQVLAPNNTLVADSAAGRLTAVFQHQGGETAVPNVRLANPTSSDLASFGTLNQTSLKNLTDYNNLGGNSVTVTLTVPSGASAVCLSDGGNNEDICVYATRTITIPSNALNRQGSYFVLTRDAENNTFQRQYILHPHTAG